MTYVAPDPAQEKTRSKGDEQELLTGPRARGVSQRH